MSIPQGQPGHPINHEKLFRNEQILCEMLAERTHLLQILMQTTRSQEQMIAQQNDQIQKLSKKVQELQAHCQTEMPITK